jgi:hypothetical protein
MDHNVLTVTVPDSANSGTKCLFTLHPLYPKHDAYKHVKAPLSCYRLLQSNRLPGGRRSINRLYTPVRPVCRYVTEPMGESIQLLLTYIQPTCQAAWKIKLLTVAPNICGSSVWMVFMSSFYC